MVLNKKAKKAQAAIEFLMTYGWMLLIVLIVGALIFSFVDFGNLIPNQINLNNNLQADATRSVAYNSDSGDPSLDNKVQVVFQYNGARKSTIQPDDDSNIELTVGDSICGAEGIQNSDTGDSASEGSGEDVTFISGQTGVMNFSCDGSTGTDLIEGDTLEGSITVQVEDPQTGISVPSTGDIRLQIN